MVRRIQCLTAVAVLLVALGARPDPVSLVKGYLQGRMDALHIPGLSVAVVRDGQILMIWSWWKANLELGVDATNDTVYELASVSKTFIAPAVMRLVERGDQQPPELLLGNLAVPDLGHEGADEHLGHRAGQPPHRLPRSLMERFGLPGLQEGDLLP
jgi:hypothetical protein